MNNDLHEVIATSKAARDRLLDGSLSVKEANGVAAHNHNIIGSYALDLRERMFAAEATATEARTQRISPSYAPAEAAE